MKKLYLFGLIVLCLAISLLTYYFVNGSSVKTLNDYEIHNVSYIADDLIKETKINFKIFKKYSDYKEFCNQYNLEEKLTKKDFNRYSYLMIYNNYTNKDDFDIGSFKVDSKSITIKASNKVDDNEINGTVIYLYSINKKNKEALNNVKITIDKVEDKTEDNKPDDDTINLSEKINNWLTDTKKDEYVVTVLAQTWCPHCNSYKPTMEEVNNEYNFKLYWVDLDLLTKTDYNTIKNTYELSHYTGTPYTFVVKNGEFISFNVGNKTKEDLINYLKASGVIE